MSFPADVVPLKVVLTDAHRFQPLQRPRWPTAAVETLLEDLINGSQQEAPQFLGCLLLNGGGPWQIVDGHQRLYAIGAVLRVGLSLGQIRGSLRAEVRHCVECLERGGFLLPGGIVDEIVTARLCRLRPRQVRQVYRHVLASTEVVRITMPLH